MLQAYRVQALVKDILEKETKLGMQKVSLSQASREQEDRSSISTIRENTTTVENKMPNKTAWRNYQRELTAYQVLGKSIKNTNNIPRHPNNWFAFSPFQK